MPSSLEKPETQAETSGGGGGGHKNLIWLAHCSRRVYPTGPASITSVPVHAKEDTDVSNENFLWMSSNLTAEIQYRRYHAVWSNVSRGLDPPAMIAYTLFSGCGFSTSLECIWNTYKESGRGVLQICCFDHNMVIEVGYRDDPQPSQDIYSPALQSRFTGPGRRSIVPDMV